MVLTLHIDNKSLVKSAANSTPVSRTDKGHNCCVTGDVTYALCVNADFVPMGTREPHQWRKI